MKPESSDELQVHLLGPVLRVLNAAVQAGQLQAYAVCGGMAALFYTEPVLTFDFDVLCRFPGASGLVDPAPLFAWLKQSGYVFGAEDRVMIHGVPVQFLAAAPGLEEEALAAASTVDVDGVPARVLTAEYLAAIMLKVGRAKDRARLVLMAAMQPPPWNAGRLEDILRRHQLTAKWKQWHEG